MILASDALPGGIGRPCTRRSAMSAGMLLAAGTLTGCALGLARVSHPSGKTVRLIVDNDFGGDPDGLFLLAHLLLSPSVDLPLVIGSHYRDFGEADLVPDKSAASVGKARELLRYFPAFLHPPLVAGRAGPLATMESAETSPATAAIIREAVRADGTMPLFYAAGGSLTELALALKAEPAIARRLTLVWIGGAEHPDLAAPPPGPGEPEYNFSLDPVAARVVFNQSDIEIWQIPRNAFRQMLVSLAELDSLAHGSAVGRYLRDQVLASKARLARNLPAHVFTSGETFTLGDTALVTLAALRSAFQPDSASSSYQVRPTPLLAEDGSYLPNPAGRPMRVYSTVDAGLTWRDFVAKLRGR